MIFSFLFQNICGICERSLVFRNETALKITSGKMADTELRQQLITIFKFTICLYPLYNSSQQMREKKDRDQVLTFENPEYCYWVWADGKSSSSNDFNLLYFTYVTVTIVVRWVINMRTILQKERSPKTRITKIISSCFHSDNGTGILGTTWHEAVFPFLAKTASPGKCDIQLPTVARVKLRIPICCKDLNQDCLLIFYSVDIVNN